MEKLFAFTVVVAVGLAGAFALPARDPGDDVSAPSPPRPVWTEVQWPFPMDPWGRGKAFRCKPADCGGEVNLYLRAKIGFCNCTTGIADDADLDRMGDLDLVGGAMSPLDAGRPITIGSMNGRKRAYALTTRNAPGKTAISVAVNDAAT
jgi:hypothetical protein